MLHCVTTRACYKTTHLMMHTILNLMHVVWLACFRSINYDERDPFLCNACGFCKYAKFDYTLTARPCCAVDPIENEEDRKKVFNVYGIKGCGYRI